MKNLNTTTQEPSSVLTVERLQADDPFENQEVMRLVELGVLPSVEAFVEDMNRMMGQAPKTPVPVLAKRTAKALRSVQRP